MAKDLTNSRLDRQNILNNEIAVDEIQQKSGIEGILWDGKMFVTREMTANFFGVDIRTISRYLEENSEELSANGYQVLRGKELKAFLEEKEFSRLGEKRLSFKYLEKLRLCVSKDLQFCDCKHEFGRDNCTAHFAHSREELTKDLGKWEFYPLDRRNYERFRKVALEIYLKQQLVNFDDFKGKQKGIYRVIIGD